MIFACAVCSGASDAAVAPAVNASMGLLLFIVAAVGGSFFRFLLFLSKRDGLSMEAAAPRGEKAAARGEEERGC